MRLLQMIFGDLLPLVPITFIVVTGSVTLVLGPYLPMPALVMLCTLFMAATTKIFR